MTHFLARLAAAVSSFGLSAALMAQTFESANFEGLTPGAGALSPGFSAYTFHTADPVGNFAGPDRLQGVVASSVIGTGQAAYLGGAGTDLALTSTTPGFLGFEIFRGSALATPAATVQLRGSATPVLSYSLDFAVMRNGGSNEQSFYFQVFDAQNAGGTGFATHSQVDIAPNNHVLLKDNQNSGYFDTGVIVADSTAYHLTVTVDYNLAQWSASLSSGATVYELASGRSIDGSGYAVSGYTSPTNGWADMNLFAAAASVSNAAFLDRLVFDNYSVTAVPESSTWAAIAGAVGLGFAGWRRRQRRVVIG